MINQLRAQFLLGFSESWSMYWSPFAALARHTKQLWATRVHRLTAQS